MYYSDLTSVFVQPSWQMRWGLVKLSRYANTVILKYGSYYMCFVNWDTIVIPFLVWQAITYLTLLKHLDNDPGPHLIVCPASVLENWERELRKWCPSFSVLQFHGAGRTAYSKELSSLAKAGLPPPFNVLLVCYSLFERHRLVIFVIFSLFSLVMQGPNHILMRHKTTFILHFL